MAAIDPIRMIQLTSEMDANEKSLQLTAKVMDIRSFREFIGIAKEIGIDVTAEAKTAKGAVTNADNNKLDGLLKLYKTFNGSL